MADDSKVGSHRRYCFLQYCAAIRDQTDMDPVWDAKRRAIAGTALPSNFPARSLLIAAGYLVTEEVAGADETELTARGLSQDQAAAVIAAIG